METLPGCSVEGGLAGSKNGVGAGGRLLQELREEVGAVRRDHYGRAIKKQYSQQQVLETLTTHH